MDTREKPLTHLAVEKSFQEFVGVVAGTKAVAVTDHQLLISDFQDMRFAKYRDAELFREIVKHPHVVVAGKEIDGDAFVPQFGELSHQPHKTFRDRILVFKPEVEDISKQVD